MPLKHISKICFSLPLLSMLLYANDCPKWYPMSSDGLVVVIPIYDISITGEDLDCDELIDSIDTDIDGDGVPNTTEIANGTDPRNPDTDGDGVGDASDVFPLDPHESSDSDGDGLGDNSDLPSISTLTPTDNKISASATANLFVEYEKFDTSITKVTGKHFTIFRGDGVVHTNFDVVAAQVSIVGHTVSVNPNSHLVYGASHYVQIDAGAFVDTTGEENTGINNTTRWNFSVASSSGPCGCDAFDNCDLPAELQQ